MVYTRPKLPAQRRLPKNTIYRHSTTSDAKNLPVQSPIAPSRARRAQKENKSSTSRLAFTDEPIDACAYIFAICKRCQTEFLNWRRIGCLFDVDSGLIPADILSCLGELLESLLSDIAHSQIARTPGATVNVTMRHKGGDWILAVSENVNGFAKPGTSNRRLAIIRALAQRINADSSVQTKSHGSLTAVMFTVPVIDHAGVEITQRITPLH